MAVLLPVLLLAGLAQKLFAPLALTVAVAMMASYFVSMAVTPVACRYFLGHVEHGRLRQGASRRVIDRIGRRLLAPASARPALPARRSSLRGARARRRAAAGRRRACRARSSPKSTSRWSMVYVRFSPGVSLDGRGEADRRDGQALSTELPEGAVEMVVANIGTPQNARSAHRRAPTSAPNTGYLRLAFSDPEERKLSQAELAAKAREILTREFPGVEVLQYPGGLVASVFANGYTAPLVVEVRSDNLRASSTRRRAPWPRSRGRSRASATSACQLQIDYPEIHVDTDREKAGFVGVDVARGRADDAGRDAREHQHARRLDRLAQRPVVLRRHLVRPRRASPTRKALAQLPVRVERRRASRCSSARTANVRRALGPDRRSSATSWSARPTCSCRRRGATSAARRGDLEDALKTRPAHARRRVRLRRPGRADAHHLRGPGPRARASRSWSCS